MKKILFYLALIIIAVLSSCNCDSKPKHKYTISVPSEYDYGGGTYHTDSYKSFDNGSIEFTTGNSIHRCNNCSVTINY